MRAMFRVQLKDRKRSLDWIFMLGLNVTMDKLAMANSDVDMVVLRREDGHIMRRALDFEVEGQRKKVWQKRTWKRQVEEESVKVGLKMEDVFCRSKWSVGVSMIAAGLR